MGGAANRLKVNHVLEGKPCGWCEKPLAAAEDAALCEGCMAIHHSACWDGKSGCSSGSCVEVPRPAPSRARAPAVAPTLAPPPAAQPYAAPRSSYDDLPPDRMRCPNCEKLIHAGSGTCQYCRKNLTAPEPGLQMGTARAPGAAASLVFGLLGLFICGFVFGWMAIQNADQAKQAIAANPNLTGGGMAAAGKVLGILDIAGWALLIAGRAMQ